MSMAVSPLRFVMGIKDSVHGIILLTPLEAEIIQSPYFERLRYLKKTGMANLVYPSHNSTRYEHSLGTLRLSFTMLRNALEHYLRRHKDDLREKISDEYKIWQIYQIIRLAALLHDIGHGPFSHTSEPILEKVLAEHHKEEYSKMKKLGFDRAHEFFTYKIILNEPTIREPIENRGINPLDVASLFAKRPVNTEKMHLKKEGWRLLRKIIDSQLDADRLDNLLRDSMGMGVPYGVVDVDNLLKNIYIYPTKNGELMLVTHIRALGAVEDMLDARYKMYRWLYYHQKVNLLDAISQNAIEKLLEHDIIRKEKFHWTGYVTDECRFLDDLKIWYILRNHYNENDFYLIKGLFNQDYLPLALWRSYEEHVALIEPFFSDIDIYGMAKKAAALFSRKKILSEFKEEVENKIGGIEFLAVTREPTTPYDWREGEEVCIYIPPDRVMRITDISLYISKLLEMSSKYIHYYLYYYVQNQKRRTIIKHKNKIREKYVNYIKAKIQINQS